jgi:uncharacterized protein YbaR (Trm112 family)
MHIVATDVLTCPRCGPEFGLILVADHVDARRVSTGALGCSNCREKYPIEDGVVRFDAGAADDVGSAEIGSATNPRASDDEAATDAAVLRLGAMLGVTHGPGFVLLAGQAVEHAAALARLIEDIEVLAVHVGALPARAAGAAGAAGPGVSPLLLRAPGATLPLAGGKVLGAALAGDAADALFEESLRVLSPVARLVLLSPPADVDARLAAQRLRVLARDETALVAARY